MLLDEFPQLTVLLVLEVSLYRIGAAGAQPVFVKACLVAFDGHRKANRLPRHPEHVHSAPAVPGRAADMPDDRFRKFLFLALRAPYFVDQREIPLLLYRPP